MVARNKKRSCRGSKCFLSTHLQSPAMQCLWKGEIANTIRPRKKKTISWREGRCRRHFLVPGWSSCRNLPQPPLGDTWCKSVGWWSQSIHQKPFLVLLVAASSQDPVIKDVYKEESLEKEESCAKTAKSEPGSTSPSFHLRSASALLLISVTSPDFLTTTCMTLSACKKWKLLEISPTTHSSSLPLHQQYPPLAALSHPPDIHAFQKKTRWTDVKRFSHLIFSMMISFPGLAVMVTSLSFCLNNDHKFNINLLDCFKQFACPFYLVAKYGWKLITRPLFVSNSIDAPAYHLKKLLEKAILSLVPVVVFLCI